MSRGPLLLGPHRAKLTGPGSAKLAQPPESALALAVTELAREAGAVGCLYVARSEARAERLARAARGFDADLQVVVLPAWDCLPYDRFSPSPAVMGRRIAALREMTQAAPPAGRLVLATVELVLQRLPSASLCTDAAFRLETGLPLSLDELRVYLIRAGYVLDDRVDEPGEAALRRTVDVFPGTDEQPFRVRLEDGVIAAIDRYDPVTQRTDASAGEAILYPASEVVLDEGCVRRFLRGEEEEAEEASAGGEPWTRRLLSGTRDEPRRVCALEHWLPLFCQRLHTVFELLPGAPLILDPEAGERRDAWFEQIAEAYRHRIAMMAASRTAQADQLPPLPPDRLYLDEAEWSRSLSGRRVVEIGENGGEAIDLGAAPVPRFVEGGDPSRALVRSVERGARRATGWFSRRRPTPSAAASPISSSAGSRPARSSWRAGETRRPWSPARSP